MAGRPGAPDNGQDESAQADAEDLEALDEILDGELVDEAPKDLRALRAVRTLTAHRGPLPSEQWLTTVEALHPGTTGKLVDDFLAERQHQREMQTEALSIDRENFRLFAGYQKLQLLAALVVVVLIAAGGITLVAMGDSVKGFATLIAELAILAGVFLGRQILESRHQASLPAPPPEVESESAGKR